MQPNPNKLQENFCLMKIFFNTDLARAINVRNDQAKLSKCVR